jgi:ribonuclease HI
MLRCIRCNRGSNKVTLSDSFECVDQNDCTLFIDFKRVCKQRATMNVSIYFDAACLGGNTADGQPLGVGVYTQVEGTALDEFCGYKEVAPGSNNIGEWTAFVYALKVAALMLQSGYKNFTFFSDSQLVVNTFNDRYKVSTKFKPLYTTTKKLVANTLGKTFRGIVWIPREHNKQADKLSKKALEHLTK